MKKGTPEDACDYCIYVNLTLILDDNVIGVLFVIAVPVLVTHFVAFVSLILIIPAPFVIEISGLYDAIFIFENTPPDDDALSYTNPCIDLTVMPPLTSVADEAVIGLPSE